jgi:hypothetical protein
MTADLILPLLNDRLWHTTHPDRFSAILKSGAILPSPPVPNPDGWKTLGGDEYCSYAKKLGGVSLFDFNHFDPESYREKCPLSSWHEFVPYRSRWGGAVWIEIDRVMISGQFISGRDLVAKWQSDKAYKHNFMPYIEAVHLGPLPCTAFKRAFRVRMDDENFYPLPVNVDNTSGTA